VRTTVVGRVAAIGAVLAAAIAVAVVLLGSSGGGRTYYFVFQNAGQLVKGDQVKNGGVVVGSIKDVQLTNDGQARIKVEMNSDLSSLREGTKATIRLTSLSGVANRYIDLDMAPGSSPKIPDGGKIDTVDTTTAVDLDQLFNTFDPKTRKALSGVFRGFAATYTGRAAQARAGVVYFNPALAATSRLFRELTYDKPELRKFIVQSADLVTDINQRHNDLAGLVRNLAATTGAIGAQRDALAEAINRLPAFMRRANTTFVNLRATLDDLAPLVEESKPVAKKLRPFLRELRPLARDARPTLRDLSRLIRQSGANNDLVELTRANVPLRNIAIGPVQANGQSREGAFPASVKALSGATPQLGFGRPYAVDLTGWFDDFSHSGFYDALGGTGRVALNVNAFALDPNGLPLPGGLLPANQVGNSFLQLAQTGLDNRCPGSSERNRDGSNPFAPPGFDCDPNQVPPPDAG
jgi:phospholipid/cholesterol/gamma-HCH transport system substrate-binding protein